MVFLVKPSSSQVYSVGSMLTFALFIYINLQLKGLAENLACSFFNFHTLGFLGRSAY